MYVTAAEWSSSPNTEFTFILSGLRSGVIALGCWPIFSCSASLHILSVMDTSEFQAVPEWVKIAIIDFSGIPCNEEGVQMSSCLLHATESGINSIT